MYEVLVRRAEVIFLASKCSRCAAPVVRTMGAIPSDDVIAELRLHPPYCEECALLLGVDDVWCDDDGLELTNAAFK